MEFSFFCHANNGEELVQKIDEVVEAFFPYAKWDRSIKESKQVKQESIIQTHHWFFKRTVAPPQVLFQVTVEVFAKGLNNALVCARPSQTQNKQMEHKPQ